jgi:hydroxypyruvate isomerase
MPKFCANISMLFMEHPFLDRFEAAEKAGFSAVECQFPYVASKEEIAERLERHNLKQVLINLPAGNWDKGDRGIACDPSRIGEFQDSIGEAIAYAHAMKCGMINCLAGIKPPQVSRGAALDAMATNVAFAATQLAREGIQLVVEPINRFDVPGFLLNHSFEALALVDAAKASDVKLQYDVYHMQRMEGELAATIERLLQRIGHIQIADTPGRHEPGTGEINFPFLFRHLDALGYDGWVGCEYKPEAGTVEGLGWLR